MIKNLLLDLDGTLIQSHHYYFKPIAKCVEIISGVLGADSPEPENLIKMAKQIRKDLQAWDSKGIDHFIHSWVELYDLLCDQYFLQADEAIKHQLVLAASEYIQEKYELNPNVWFLQTFGFNRAICTLGLYDVQWRKLKTSGLEALVPPSRWVIVHVKNMITYRQTLRYLDWKASETVMLGDNLKLDILPSLEAGMSAVYLKSNHISAHEISDKELKELEKYKKHSFGKKWYFKEITRMQELSDIFKIDNMKYRDSL